MTALAVPAEPDADAVEVIDETNGIVMTFASQRDAEWYGLTGEPNWTSSRLMVAADRAGLAATLTLGNILRAR